jgi:hypothetical protein
MSQKSRNAIHAAGITCAGPIFTALSSQEDNARYIP